jgi:hypothetical protein
MATPWPAANARREVRAGRGLGPQARVRGLHEGWGAAHRFALAGGALLTCDAWAGFLLTGLLGRAGPIHLVGNAIFASGAAVLLAVSARTVRSSSSHHR